MENKPWYIEEFRKRYAEAYKGILEDKWLENGNEWYERLLTSVAQKEYERGLKFEMQAHSEEMADIKQEAYERGRQDGIKSIGLEKKKAVVDKEAEHMLVKGYNWAVDALEQQKQAKLKE